MFKLADIAVNRKLALQLIIALAGALILLVISVTALKHNLMAEREARLMPYCPSPAAAFRRYPNHCP